MVVVSCSDSDDDDNVFQYVDKKQKLNEYTRQMSKIQQTIQDKVDKFHQSKKLFSDIADCQIGLLNSLQFVTPEFLCDYELLEGKINRKKNKIEDEEHNVNYYNKSITKLCKQMATYTKQKVDLQKKIDNVQEQLTEKQNLLNASAQLKEKLCIDYNRMKSELAKSRDQMQEMELTMQVIDTCRPSTTLNNAEFFYHSLIECPVCLTPKTGNTCVKLPNCFHNICKECISQLQTKKCPYCRTNFTYHYEFTYTDNQYIMKMKE